MDGMLDEEVRMTKQMCEEASLLYGVWMSVDGCRHPTFIGEIVENVHCFDRSLSSLLVPEDKIDPVMQIRRDVFAL